MEETGSQPVLSQEEAFAGMRLLRSPNIGPVSYRQLLARFGNAAASLVAETYPWLLDLALRWWALAMRRLLRSSCPVNLP
jgi:hypothetical protein